MRSLFAFVIVAAILWPAAAGAQTDRPFGLGIIIGEPTGISAKLYLSRANALQGALAWSLQGNNDIQIDGDYLFHRYDWITVEKGQLPVYFGIGGGVSFREHADDIVGIRFPIGLDYIFEDVPLDVFVQLVPIFEIVPSTDVELNGALGIRFFF